MRGDLGFPVRVQFTKLGKVRFVSHRDVARAFERAFRIEQLPLAFTQGFSPRPKVSFGLALGVGHESVAEYLDLELREAVDVEALPDALSAALPDGIDVTGAAALVERAPSLQEAVDAVEVHLTFDGLTPEVVEDAVTRALAADTLTVETMRKGKTVVEDLRPTMRRLAIELSAPVDSAASSRPSGHSSATSPSVTNIPVVVADVGTRPRGIRPADLLTALRALAGVSEHDGEDRVLRTHQWIERDGARREPLEADRAARTATPVRATSKGPTDERRDHPGGNDLRADPTADAASAERRIA